MVKTQFDAIFIFSEESIYDDVDLPKDLDKNTHTLMNSEPREEKQEPVIVDLSQPSDVFASSTSQMKSEASPPKPPRQDLTKRDVVHKTVIKIGSATSSKTPCSPGQLSGKTTLAPSPPPLSADNQCKPHPDSFVSSSASSISNANHNHSSLNPTASVTNTNSTPISCPSENDPTSKTGDTKGLSEPALLKQEQDCLATNGHKEEIDGLKKDSNSSSAKGNKFHLPNDIVTRL